MQNNRNKRSAEVMDVHGESSHVHNILVCVELNKVVTLLKQSNIRPKTTVKYTIAKATLTEAIAGPDKAAVHGETFTFVIAGRDETDKMIEMSWVGADMLKSFISLLVPAEWIVYVK